MTIWILASKIQISRFPDFQISRFQISRFRFPDPDFQISDFQIQISRFQISRFRFPDPDFPDLDFQISRFPDPDFQMLMQNYLLGSGNDDFTNSEPNIFDLSAPKNSLSHTQWTNCISFSTQVLVEITGSWGKEFLQKVDFCLNTSDHLIDQVFLNRDCKNNNKYLEVQIPFQGKFMTFRILDLNYLPWGSAKLYFFTPKLFQPSCLIFGLNHHCSTNSKRIFARSHWEYLIKFGLFNQLTILTT